MQEMSQNESFNEERKVNAKEPKDKCINNSCFLPSMLFIIVTAGFILAIVGLVFLRPFTVQHGSNLCTHLPKRKECKRRPMDIPENVTVLLSTAEETFLALIYVQTVCIFLQFFAVAAVCSRIIICAKHICVKACYSVWKNGCKNWGLGWVFIDGFAGILCLSSCIAVAAAVDGVTGILGFLLCLGNGIFGAVKLAGSLLYHWGIGCPPNDTFLGTSLKYKDVKIDKQPIEIDTYAVDRYGNEVFVGRSWTNKHSLHIERK